MTATYLCLSIVVLVLAAAPTTFASSRNLQTSGSGYYFLPRGTSCPKENIIKDVDQCETAGLAFGGILRDGFNPFAGTFGTTPGGCSVQISSHDVRTNSDGAIVFDTDFDNQDQEGLYFPVCVEPISSDYEFRPAGVRGCGSKSATIDTAEECKTAAMQLGGKLRNGETPVTGSWSTVPCGCSIQKESGYVVFDENLGDSCAQEDGLYFPVCKKQEATRYSFLPTGAPGCPKDLRITTPEECRKAGVRFGGTLRDTANPVTGSWDFAPCGCSISNRDGDLRFDTDLDNCQQSGDWTPVCQLPPLPELAVYYFDYNIRNMVFGDFDDLSTETRSTMERGLVENCAGGSTAGITVDMEFTIGNSQSLTVSKSFTSSRASSVTAGVSVTATAEAGAIFAKASVSATASFEYSKEWGSEATSEDSQTLETTNQISLSGSRWIQVEEGFCVQAILSSEVTTEPAQIPYTADVQLKVFERDGDSKGSQITDADKLNEVLELLVGYDAMVDAAVISYEIEGIFTGTYASESKITTENCDACDRPRTSSPVPLPLSLPPLASPTRPQSLKPMLSPVITTTTNSTAGNSTSGVGKQSLVQVVVALMGMAAVLFV